MRKQKLDQDFPVGENLRIIKRLWKVDKSDNFPQGLEFALQLLFRKDSVWVQVARIDNQLHKGKPGVHIHIHSKVVWEDMSFEEAGERILQLAETWRIR